MQLSYAGIALAANAATVAISREAVLNMAGVPYEYRERWDVQAQVFGDDQAALKVAINDVVTAFSIQGGDLLLYHNDGTTLSSHTLVNAATLSGVRVVSGPSFPQGQGAEYATYRTFNVALEAEFPATLFDGLIEFEETLAFEGGGPLFTHLQPVNGPPQKQLLAEFTPFRAMQDGHAVGYLSWPLPSLPIWPGALVRAGSPRRTSPRKRPGGFTHFPVQWRYEFESVLPLLGDPHVWVG